MRRVAGRLLLLVVLLMLLAALGLVLFRLSGDARALFQCIARYSAFAYAAQLVATAGLWCGWRAMVTWLVSRGIVPEQAGPPLMQRRGRWCAALLGLQLILLASAVSRPA